MCHQVMVVGRNPGKMPRVEKLLVLDRFQGEAVQFRRGEMSPERLFGQCVQLKAAAILLPPRASRRDVLVQKLLALKLGRKGYPLLSHTNAPGVGVLAMFGPNGDQKIVPFLNKQYTSHN